jgi:hypothetical protein
MPASLTAVVVPVLSHLQMLPDTPWVDSSPSRGTVLLPDTPGQEAHDADSSAHAATGSAPASAVDSLPVVSTASSAQQPSAGQHHGRQGAGNSSTPMAGVLEGAPKGTRVKRWGNTNDPTYGDMHFYNYRDDCQVRLLCCRSNFKGTDPYAAGVALPWGLCCCLACTPPKRLGLFGQDRQSSPRQRSLLAAQCSCGLHVSANMCARMRQSPSLRMDAPLSSQSAAVSVRSSCQAKAYKHLAKLVLTIGVPLACGTCAYRIGAPTPMRASSQSMAGSPTPAGQPIQQQPRREIGG